MNGAMNDAKNNARNDAKNDARNDGKNDAKNYARKQAYTKIMKKYRVMPYRTITIRPLERAISIYPRHARYYYLVFIYRHPCLEPYSLWLYSVKN